MNDSTYHYQQFSKMRAIFSGKKTACFFGIEWEKDKAPLISRGNSFQMFLENENLFALPANVRDTDGNMVRVSEIPPLGAFNRGDITNPNFRVKEMWGWSHDQRELTMMMYGLTPESRVNHFVYRFYEKEQKNWGVDNVHEFEEVALDHGYYNNRDMRFIRRCLKEKRYVETPKGMMSVHDFLTSDDPDVKEMHEEWLAQHNANALNIVKRLYPNIHHSLIQE